MASNEHRQIFGIIVRAIGLIITLYGPYSVWLAVMRLFALQTHYNMSTGSFLALSLFYFAIGLIVLRRATASSTSHMAPGPTEPLPANLQELNTCPILNRRRR